MATIDLPDIQGIVLRGYGAFDISRFALLRVTNAVAARVWLGKVASAVTGANAVAPSSTAAPDPVFNLAFTCEGLRAFGLRDANMAGFSNEFRDGMVTPHHQRLLGDFGPSDPLNWYWGGPNTAPVHVMMMLYAPDETSMERFWESHRRQLSASGLECIKTLPGTTLNGRKEHFGFRDGIGQPLVEGCDLGPESNQVAPGEFVLGYKNEYNVLPDTPVIAEAQGDMSLLSADRATGAYRDFGRNGSYLVFRQMSQDVRGFWGFVREHAGSDQAAVKLASQMVGRWPSGAPLTVYPDADPGGLSDDDDFGYRTADPHGERSPIGSHVRRTNPRDGLLDSNSEQSTRIVNHHRMIRRGRAYGMPAVESMNPIEMMRTPNPAHEVGLHFMCFNANIANQFQFVQFNWAGAKFERFYNDPDPLIGVRAAKETEPPRFTIPAAPVRKVVPGLKRFVEVRGGAYLFMPGKRALEFLASIRDTGV